MTIHHQTPKETVATDAPVSEKRRTLIKASATVPLAATLFSGSALATSSLACMGGDFSNMKFRSHGNSINGDTAVRVPVDYYKKKKRKDCPKKLRGELNKYDNDLYKIDGGLYHNSGRLNGVPSNILNKCYKKPEKAYVLKLYDECGTALGAWPKIQRVEDGGYGTPITGSCLTSIAVSDSCNII